MDEKEEALRAVLAVIDAWTIKGRAPEYHVKMQEKLRKEWPMLAKALDRLVEADAGKGRKS